MKLGELELKFMLSRFQFVGSNLWLSAPKCGFPDSLSNGSSEKFSKPVISGDSRRAHNRACRPEGQVQGGGGAVARRAGGLEEEQEENLPWDGQADRNVHQPAPE